jgi:hypothetical protein
MEDTMSRPVVFLGGPVDGKTVGMMTPLPTSCAVPPMDQSFSPGFGETFLLGVNADAAAVYRLGKVGFPDGGSRPIYRAVDETEEEIERLMRLHLDKILET